MWWQNLDTICARSETSRRKSLTGQTLDIRVSKTSARRAKKLLKPRVSKTTDLFCVCGIVKEKLYKRNPQTLEELKNDIRRDISTIPMEELPRVNYKLFRRYTECIRSGGQKFHHLLYNRYVLIRLSKGYYHRESLSNSIYQLSPLPRRGVRRNVGGAPDRHFSVKHKKITILIQTTINILHWYTKSNVCDHWFYSLYIILGKNVKSTKIFCIFSKNVEVTNSK